jgi:AraC-like DNA-binding protein
LSIALELTTIPVRYVQIILDAAIQKGCDGDELLAKSGIRRELLGQDKARVSAKDYYAFTNLVIKTLEDELCGFMNRPAKIGTFEMMTQACIQCPTLGEFMRRSAKFNNLFTDSIVCQVGEANGLASYSLHTKVDMTDQQNFLPFIMLGIAHRLFSWVLDQPLLLKAATFPHKRPLYANEYNFLFKTSVRFDQSHYSIQFPASYLDMPNRQTEQTLQEFLKIPGIQLMSLSDSENSIVVRVTHMISDYVNQDFPEFETIAEKTCMTSVTLRRRLREEGSSYRQIKDDLRRDTAIYNLGRGHLSIEQVAESVGFAEPTSFFRAFKRWTGVTPRAYISKN